MCTRGIDRPLLETCTQPLMGPWLSSPVTGSTLRPKSPSWPRVKNSKKIWTSSGILRMYSMKALATLATIQLLDSREIPISTPRIVASAIPATESRIVLTMPTQRARPPVSGALSMPSPMLKSGLTFRKSKPVLIPLALRLSPASPTRKIMARITAMSVTTCTIHLTTVASR